MRHKQHSHECTDCFCTFVRLYTGCTPSQLVEEKAQHASELREPAKQEEWRSPEGALGKFLLQKQDNGGRAPTRKRWEQVDVTNSANLRMESVAGRFCQSNSITSTTRNLCIRTTSSPSLLASKVVGTTALLLEPSRTV